MENGKTCNKFKKKVKEFLKVSILYFVVRNKLNVNLKSLMETIDYEIGIKL